MKTEKIGVGKTKPRSLLPFRSLTTSAGIAVISALLPCEGAAADLNIYGGGGGGGGDNGGGGAGAVIHYDGSTYAQIGGPAGGNGFAGGGGTGFGGLPFTVIGGRGGYGGGFFGANTGAGKGSLLIVTTNDALSVGDITMRGGQGGWHVSSSMMGKGGDSNPSYSGGSGGTPSGTGVAGQGGDIDFYVYQLAVAGDIDVLSGATAVSSADPAGNVSFSAGILEAVGAAAQNFTFHNVSVSNSDFASYSPKLTVAIENLLLFSDVTLSFLNVMPDDDIQVRTLMFSAGQTLSVVNTFDIYIPGSAANLRLGGDILTTGPGAVLDMSGSSLNWDSRGQSLIFDTMHPGLAGQPMLTYVSGGGNLLVEGSWIVIFPRSADEVFTQGDTLTLISGPIDPGSGLTQMQTRAWAGATYYDFDLVLDALGLGAVFRGQGVDMYESRTYVHGLEAGMLFMRSRGDAIADSLANQLPRLHGPFAFSSVSGGHLKGGQGKRVSVDSGFAAAGLGVGVEGEGMYTAVGVFLDYGFGNWKGRNSSAVALRSFKGDLESHGIGVIGRMDFDRAGVRVDASFSYGRIKNELSAMSDLLDHAATYDYRADTWNVHLGGRKLFALTQNHGLEVNAAVLYTWQDSDSFLTSFGERLKAESGDSFRTRLGARYVLDTAPGAQGDSLRLFVGGTWEKEYRGKSGLRLERETIDYGNALRGDSGLGEVGVMWNTAGWEINLTATGRFGDTKGYGGMASASFRF